MGNSLCYGFPLSEHLRKPDPRLHCRWCLDEETNCPLRRTAAARRGLPTSTGWRSLRVYQQCVYTPRKDSDSKGHRNDILDRV